MSNTRKKTIRTVYKEDESENSLDGDFSDSGSEFALSNADSSSDTGEDPDVASSDENFTEKNPKQIKRGKITCSKRKPKFTKNFLSKVSTQESNKNEEKVELIPFDVKDLTEQDKLLPEFLNLSESESSDEEAVKPVSKSLTSTAKSYYPDVDKNNEASTSKGYIDVFQNNESQNSSMEVAQKEFTQFQMHHDKIAETKAQIDEYSSKKKGGKQKKIKVADLLAMGEEFPEQNTSNKDVEMQSSDESGVEDWEEVKEAKAIPQGGIQLVVDFPGAEQKRNKKIDVEMMMRRKINRVKKEYQVYMHKVHVLCWIGHGNYVNHVLNQPDVLAIALTLVPSEKCYPEDRVNLQYLEDITKWYKDKITLKTDKNENKFRPNAPPLNELLIKQMRAKTVTSKKYLAFIFVCILRALGINCRLMLNFVTLPLKPPPSQLCSLSTKKADSNDKSKSSEKKPTSKSKPAAVRSMSQLDGNDDDGSSCWKRLTSCRKGNHTRKDLKECGTVTHKINKPYMSSSRVKANNLKHHLIEIAKSKENQQAFKRHSRSPVPSQGRVMLGDAQTQNSITPKYNKCTINSSTIPKIVIKSCEGIETIPQLDGADDPPVAMQTRKTRARTSAASKEPSPPKKIKLSINSKSEPAVEEKKVQQKVKHLSQPATKEKENETPTKKVETETKTKKSTSSLKSKIKVEADMKQKGKCLSQPGTKEKENKTPIKKNISNDEAAASSNKTVSAPSTKSLYRKIKADLIQKSEGKDKTAVNEKNGTTQPKEKRLRQPAAEKKEIKTPTNKETSHNNKVATSSNKTKANESTISTKSLIESSVKKVSNKRSSSRLSNISNDSNTKETPKRISRKSSVEPSQTEQKVSNKKTVKSEFFKEESGDQKTVGATPNIPSIIIEKAEGTQTIKKSKLSLNKLASPETTSDPKRRSKSLPGKEPMVKSKHFQGKATPKSEKRVSHRDICAKIAATKTPSPRNTDVKKNLISIVKNRISEAKASDPKRKLKARTKTTPDSDSDFLPEETAGSDAEFKPKLKTPKAKNKLTALKGDRRVLSSDEESVTKRNGVDVWCEVYVESEEQWISVDLIKGQVHCVNEIYGRASHPVSYVIGWDNTNRLKDLTRRYVPHWNTVTRKKRVEPEWLEKALKPWKGIRDHRDIEEDRQLDRMQLDAPLPKTVFEYKNHPLYALQRHLLKFEVIYPPDAPPLGYVREEPVFARECVFTCRSRDTWLKEAKTVKMGEKPYKIVKARPKWDRLSNKAITDIPLEIFGPWQVQDYDPPAAENGLVPRNAYGNVELFKMCMLPKGTVHIDLPGLNKVAKKLNIDCAPAMVGFDFHGGWTHPVFQGFVVCKEFEETITEAWTQEQEEIERKQREKIEQRVYGNWKKLIKGLLIKERLREKYSFEEPKKEVAKSKNKGPRFLVKKK